MGKKREIQEEKQTFKREEIKREEMEEKFRKYKQDDPLFKQNENYQLWNKYWNQRI